MEQQGAVEQMQTLMEKYGYEKLPSITDQEQSYINILKKHSNEDTDILAAIYEEENNTPFVKLEGRILPLKYEGEVFINPEEAILHTRYRTTQTEQGFTIQRKQRVKKVPRIDSLAIFEQGLNETKWYIHMQPEISNIRQLVKKKSYVEKAGVAASNWWKDHLDIVSRRGWSAKAAHTEFSSLLRLARGNMNTAVLGYKLSAIVMQPFAVIDAMAYTQSRWGTAASLEILKEFTKAWVIPGHAQRFIDVSPKLQLRRGGEIAIEETLQKIGRSEKSRDKFIRGGLALLQRADVITAAGAQKGLLNILQNQGVPSAAKEAGILMDMVSSSADVTFRPHILARGEGARTWFTFQTFFLNRWGLVAHDLIAKGLIKGKDWKARYSAMLGLAIIVAGKIAEDEAREFLFESISGKELPERSIVEQALLAVPANIPIFGNMIDSFSGRGGGEIPIMRILENLFGARRIITAKTPQGQTSAAIKAAEAGVILATGLPGTAQAADVIERVLIPENKRKKRRIISPRLANPT